MSRKKLTSRLISEYRFRQSTDLRARRCWVGWTSPHDRFLSCIAKYDRLNAAEPTPQPSPHVVAVVFLHCRLAPGHRPRSSNRSKRYRDDRGRSSRENSTRSVIRTDGDFQPGWEFKWIRLAENMRSFRWSSRRTSPRKADLGRLW